MTDDFVGFRTSMRSRQFDSREVALATYVLIHGAGSDSWYWHPVVGELSRRGHAVVAPDLPSGDDSAGLAEYAEAVVNAVGDLILVAQSLGGFVAPLVCARVPVTLLVLVAAMVPRPGEPAGDWFVNTGWPAARRAHAGREGRTVDDEVDVLAEFFHDVPPDVVSEAFSRGEPQQSDRPFGDPWPLEAWPNVPTKFVLRRDDRFSRPTSCGASFASVSGSPRTRSEADIFRRSAILTNSSTCLRNPSPESSATDAR